MKFFEKEELKVLWPFYLDMFISLMFFFVPAFLVVYFKSLEFSFFQIGLIMAVYPLFALIFEVPTGAIADIYGRKLSVLLSFVLASTGFMLMYFFTNFYAILAIQAFLGFAGTFWSGAKEAWVVDLLKGRNKKYLKTYFSKNLSIGGFGLVISGFIGALAVKFFGLKIIWLAAALGYVSAFIILSFAKENYNRKKISIKDSFKILKKQSVDSLEYSRNHQVIFYFLAASMIVIFGYNLNTGISWVPVMQSLGFPDHAFGYMWSAIALTWTLGPLITNKLLKKQRTFIIKYLFLPAIAAMMAVFVNSIFFAFLVFMSFEFFMAGRKPAERMFFHRFIPSKMRATIGSVESMLLSIVGLIALPINGLLVDTIGGQKTIFIGGFLLIPAAIIFMKIKEEK
ncbi:MFS transporter [Candidatus Woesearchaeota archaeon]|nr:MFS transporter [Candidatus Woesearchaeota archaeon]